MLTYQESGCQSRLAGFFYFYDEAGLEDMPEAVFLCQSRLAGFFYFYCHIWGFQIGNSASLALDSYLSPRFHPFYPTLSPICNRSDINLQLATRVCNGQNPLPRRQIASKTAVSTHFLRLQRQYMGGSQKTWRRYPNYAYPPFLVAS